MREYSTHRRLCRASTISCHQHTDRGHNSALGPLTPKRQCHRPPWCQSTDNTFNVRRAIQIERVEEFQDGNLRVSDFYAAEYDPEFLQRGGGEAQGGECHVPVAVLGAVLGDVVPLVNIAHCHYDVGCEL